ncbi:AEC family transporter [Enterococcus sp. LJL90]
MVSAYVNILIIFALMFIGYLLSYKQWFNNQTADVFSKLILNIGLPCNMFLNITSSFSREEFLHLFSGMVIPIFSMLLTYGFSLLYAKVMKVEKKHFGTFSTMFTCSNTIFIGLPINLAIFGEASVPYVLLYYIVNTTIFWTIGVFMIAKDNPQIEAATVSFHPTAALKKIFTPPLMGFLIGLLWIFLEWPVPQMATTFFSYLGNLTTPLSMFFIGIIIFFTGIKNIRLTKDTFGVLIGRFVISPLLVILLGHFIQVPALMLSVFIVQSSMPVQNSVPILARSYGGDTEFAASSMTWSVLIYLFYIPILLAIIL